MQQLRKITAASVAAFAGLALAACSGSPIANSDLSSGAPTTAAPAANTAAPTTAPPKTTPPAAKAKELAVIESAFGQDASDPSTWWYVVIVENPNTDYVFANADVTIEANDASGVILDSGEDYVNLLPGKTALTGRLTGVGSGTIAELNVRGPLADAATKADGALGSMTVSDVKSSRKSKWEIEVTGLVTSAFVSDQDLVKVVVVTRDASGKIIGGDFTFIDRLPSGGKVQFSNTIFDTKNKVPATATFEAYPSL